jgi:hypothetical protein
MADVTLIGGSIPYYKIQIWGPYLTVDRESGNSGMPETKRRSSETAAEQLRAVIAPDYLAHGVQLFPDLQIFEADNFAMVQSTNEYNATYRISKADADAIVAQQWVLDNQLRPVEAEPTGPVIPTPQELADICPDRAAFAIHEDKYKVTVVINNVDLEFDPILQATRMEAEFDAARQIAANFNSAISSNQIRYQSEEPSGHYVGPPGSAGVRIQQLGTIMREAPAGGGTLYQCQSPAALVASTGKFIGSYSAPVSGVTNVSVVPGGEEAPAEEDPSEAGPAGDDAPAPSADALGPADADPNAPPGVGEREGNYVITVIVPDGEDATEEAKNELAKYVTDSTRGSSANISIDGDLTELSSTPADAGGVDGKKILLIGDSQWDSPSEMGNIVKEALEAQGAEVRTLWKYGKGLAVATDYWGVSVASNGNTTVSPSGLLGSMLSSFQPNIVVVALGGNDSYRYGSNSKKAKYKTVLAGWMSAFEGVDVTEVRWLGPSYASKIRDNGRPYDNLRQKIREHQEEFIGSYSGNVRTTWTSTVPLTQDLQHKTDGVHFVSGNRGYGEWGNRMVAPSSPIGDLMTGEAEGARRVQYAVPVGDVEVTSKPPKGGGEYKPPPASAADSQRTEGDDKGTGEVNIEPIDFQCVLMRNIRQLSGMHQTQPYKHTIRVMTDGAPGSVMSIIDHGNMTNEVRELLSLCPEVYGALSPYLKITRVEYTEKGKVKRDHHGDPIEKELRIPNFVSERDVEDILAGKRSRISGAGVKKFSWELKGVQPAEVDNNITAKLEVYFQSVGDFFGGATQAGGNVPNFLDLIINSAAVRQVKNKSGTGGQSPSKKPKTCPVNKAISQEYDGASFRIKVCAGWSPPEDMEAMFPTMSAAKVKLLRDAIMASRVSLFLQQVRHNIQFNENGSLLLSIDYHAALSGLLRGSTADIFADGKAKDEIERLRADKTSISEDEAAATEDGQTLSDKEKEKFGEQTDELLKKIDELEQADKLQKYRMLLEGLFKSQKVQILTLNATDVYGKGIDQMTHEERVEFARARQSPEYFTSDKRSVAGGEFEGSVLESIPDEGGTTEDVGKKVDKEIKKEDKTKTKQAKKQKGMVQIPYMYLGDIIENVLSQIKINNGEELHFKFFLSEVDLIDPLVALQVKGFADYVACGNVKDAIVLDAMEASSGVTVKGEQGLIITMNIGDIPISLDAFQKWFTDKVIKASLDKYYFLNFIKDICAQLISNALKSRCFGKKYKFFQRFDAQPLSLGDAKNLRGLKTVMATTLANHKRKLTCETTAADSALGIILISTDSKPKSLKGDFEQDLKKGIYHNYIGSSCGLVKKINFNREEMPYLRESKIQKQGALGAAQLRELYSVNIDLVGNNLYRNGSYVYVSPLLLDTTMEELEFLGLHGYYLVTSVSSEVTETSFVTKMKALHEGVKFGGSSTPSGGEATPSPSPSANPDRIEEEKEEKRDIPWIPFF